MSDTPCEYVTLKPHDVKHVRRAVPLAAWYDLLPGSYTVRFYYDLRALDNPVLTARYARRNDSTDNKVPWTSVSLDFRVLSSE